MRKLLLVILIVACWMGCGGETTPPAGQTAPQPQPQPPAPSTGLRSATLAPVSSDRLASIGKVTTLVPDAPDPGVDDILVADARSGAHPVIEAFLDAGKTVIFVNADAATKNGEMLKLTHIATRLDSSVLVMRRGSDSHGRSAFHFFDWPVTSGDDARFERELASFLQAPAQERPGSPPPPGLLYATFDLFRQFCPDRVF